MKTEIKSYYPSGEPEYEAGLIECECGNPNHQLYYKKWDEKNYGKTVCIGVRLDKYLPFISRIKEIFNYLFKKDNLTVTEFIISKENISGFKDFINFLEDKQNEEI